MNKKQYLYIPGGFMIGNFIGQTAAVVNPWLYLVLLVGVGLTMAGLYYIGRGQQ